MNAGIGKYVYLIWRIKEFLSGVFYFLRKVELYLTTKLLRIMGFHMFKRGKKI